MNYLNFIKDYLYRKNNDQKPNVLDNEATIEAILNKRLSVARFGDGEIDLLLDINHPKYQNYNKMLVEKLRETLNTEDERLMICVPKIFEEEDLILCNKRAKRHWKKFVSANRKDIYGVLNFNRTYGNALFTRNYIDLQDKSGSKSYFSRIREIWQNRDIIIIEGKYTRFGVGNDLLDNARTIKRILCPEKNAFDSYSTILQKAKICSKGGCF